MSLDRAAWSWTEHLRHGGTTTWAAWVAAARDRDVAVPAGWHPPGAAQLELVRRLADRPAARPLLAAGTFHRLADLVLQRSAPGRGMAPAPLAWPASATLGPGFGAPPADPADVPRAELVRVGVGVLAELLVRSPGAPAAARLPRRRPLSRPFQLCGAPVTTDAVRRSLAVAGQVEGGRPPQVVLLAEPLDEALAQVWSARVQDGVPVRWRGFLDRWARRAARGELPPSVDYPALAALWAAQVGPERVHVVAAPPDLATAVSTVATALGLPPARGRRRRCPAPQWQPLSAEGVDVLRRVGAVLGVRVAEPEHRRAVRRLAGLLAQQRPRRLAVPEEHRPWVARRAAEVAAALREGGYAVHGDLERLAQLRAGGPTGPRAGAELGLVLDGCARLAALELVGEAEPR